MKIEAKCNQCNQVHYLDVTIEGYRAWKSGVLIQKALDQLSEDERELLISGTCGPCFDAMFKGSEEN